jgi:osmotically-inducible protein OsmY
MKVSSLLKGWIAPVVVVFALAGCAGDSNTRSTGTYVDDASITAQVKTKLINDDKTKAHNINVDTYNGVVSLSGFVESDAEAKQAIALAQQVEGVKSVKNDLHLRQN